MRTELQNHAWACLPKEARYWLRNKYKHYINAELISVLNGLFGSHNLTSDIEPEELLYVERNRVQEMYPHFNNHNTFNRGVIYALDTLFSDKCLPDKSGREVNFPTKNDTPDSSNPANIGKDEQTLEEKAKEIVETIKDSIENPIQIPETMLIPNKEEQAKPKFSIGDKVRVSDNAELTSNRGKIATIVKQGECCKGYGWVLDISKSVFLESELEPYTEETNQAIDDYFGRKTKLSPEVEEMIDKTTNEMTNGLINQLKTNMEEKELNLCELLKGCEEETFYSLIEGDVQLSSICDISIFCGHYNYHLRGCLVSAQSNGICLLYPSRALYKKYPLDAYSAWMEWMESRRKYVLEVKLSSWFDEGDKHLWNTEWFEFNSKEEVQQAAEGLREYLQKFNEK